MTPPDLESSSPDSHASSPPIGRVETDAFCACGYNLHTLAVVMDERLSIPICRCPECGKFHAVGKETGANSLWLSRLGCFLTTFWFLFVFALLAWAAVGLFGMQVGYTELLWDLRRPGAYYRGSNTPDPETFVGLMLGGCALAGFVYACMVTVLLWHVSRARQAYILFLPPLATFLLVQIAGLDGWRTITVMTAADWTYPPLAEMLGMVIGILVGRAIARGVLRMFLPPRLLHTLGFLWHIDGMHPPAIRPENPTTCATAPAPPRAPTPVAAASPLE